MQLEASLVNNPTVEEYERLRNTLDGRAGGGDASLPSAAGVPG